MLAVRRCCAKWAQHMEVGDLIVDGQKFIFALSLGLCIMIYY